MTNSEEGSKKPPFDAPTLAQVAKLAGVSLTTASNVLTGTGRPSAGTKARVRRVAEMLRYEANIEAQNLRAGTSLPIAAIVIDERTMTAGTSAVAPPHTYWFRFLNAVWGGLAEKSVPAVTIPTDRVGLLRRIPVAVVLWVSTITEPIVEDNGLAPIVVPRAPGEHEPERIRGFVHYDHAASANQAIDVLEGKGAARIMLISGPAVPWLEMIVNQYRTRCAAAGYEPVVIDGTQSPDRVCQGVADAIANGYDACFDLVPWVGGSLAGATEAGKEVPTDFQIVAHLEEQTSLPQLAKFTVVSPRAVKAAQKTVGAVLNLLAAPTDIQDVVVSCDVVIGDTTRA